MKRMLATTSAKVLLGLLSLLLILRFSYPQWNTTNLDSTITWDDAGYYAYLPATFIYNDLEQLQFLDSVNKKYPMAPMLYFKHESPTGKKYIMYPVGVALMETPWFIIGHLSAKVFGFPADGYSLPYRLALSFGSLLYVFIAFVLIRKILRQFFDDRSTAITLVLLLLGTNLLTFASWYNLGGNMHSFLLVALIIYSTIGWHQKPNWKSAIIVGVALGLATIVRPTNAVFSLFPLLYGLHTPFSRSQKWANMRSHFTMIVVAAAAGLVVVAIQLIYWKSISGSWFFFSYPGEWFDFTKPHLTDVLFSYNKGWLLYSPLIVIPLIGCLGQLKTPQAFSWPIALIIYPMIFVISSWSNWWYGGGGFGHRAFLEYYPLLALPLCYFVGSLLEKKGPFKWITLTTIFLFVLLSMFQTWQWTNRINCVLDNTKSAYWSSFFSTEWKREVMDLRYREYNPEDLQTIDESMFDSRLVADFNFLSKTDSGYTGLYLSPERLYSPAFSSTINEVRPAINGGWMNAEVRLNVHDTAHLSRIYLVSDFENHKQDRAYFYYLDSISKTTVNESGVTTAHLRLQFPKHRYSNDQIKFYLYNKNQDSINIEILGFKLYMMEPKPLTGAKP